MKYDVKSLPAMSLAVLVAACGGGGDPTSSSSESPPTDAMRPGNVAGPTPSLPALTLADGVHPPVAPRAKQRLRFERRANRPQAHGSLFGNASEGPGMARPRAETNVSLGGTMNVNHLSPPLQRLRRADLVPATFMPLFHRFLGNRAHIDVPVPSWLAHETLAPCIGGHERRSESNRPSFVPAAGSPPRRHTPSPPPSAPRPKAHRRCPDLP